MSAAPPEHLTHQSEETPRTDQTPPSFTAGPPSAELMPANRALAPVPRPLGRHEEIAASNGWEFVDLTPETGISPETLAALPGDVAREFNALPVHLHGKRISVAVDNPGDVSLRSEFGRRVPGYTIRFVYADPTQIRLRVDAVYSGATEASLLATAASTTTTGKDTDLGRLDSASESEPGRALRLIIEQAVRVGASDIHFETDAHGLTVRYRVDGDLRVAGRYPGALARPIITKVKVDAKMSPDNFMVPESGKLSFEMRPGTRPFEIRVETTPTAWGDGATMRIQRPELRRLETMGLTPHNDTRFRSAIHAPEGLLIITGPVNSGKSSLMWAALHERINEKTKILTYEDPVEYRFDSGVEQTEINEAQGMTFAEALKSAMRRDPNVIMVGEVRDPQTAEAAIKASITGHLVITTLHVADAASTVQRLRGLGVAPDLLAGSLLGAVGQRLVKRLCAQCRIARPITHGEIESLGYAHLPGATSVVDVFEARPDGCPECVNGFSGRVPIQEVMIPDDALIDAINDDRPPSVIRALARQAGMRTMAEDGWDKVARGLTSLSQVSNKVRGHR